MIKKLPALLFAALLFASAPSSAADPANTVNLELKGGTVVIEMLPAFAPKHVERIKELIGKGFYDGIVFHRVIEGFMAQTGDPTGTGTGGSGQHISAEFNTEPFVRGTVGMARSSDPNSGDSQFFIVTADSRFLDNQYTLWGRVISGMQFVDQIAKGEPPANPDKIISMKMAAPDSSGMIAAPAPMTETTPMQETPVATPPSGGETVVPGNSGEIPASDE